MAWEMLPHPYPVKVRHDDKWTAANAWAVNPTTGELDVTFGARILGPADRPSHATRLRVGPADWLAEGDPIPGIPVESS
jgi:hypothetical protein